MNRLIKTALASFAGLAGMSLVSCHAVFEDLEPCAQGVELKFVYDYHMEPGANAFPANVDCVNVMVFDTLGNYLTHFAESSLVLKDESYRMQLPLDPGSYHLVVYGGIGCEHPAFNINHDWDVPGAGIKHKDDIVITLPVNGNNESNKQLHDIEARTGGLFYGSLDLKVETNNSADTYQQATVYMMKDTNHIQVILQELASPSSVDYNDYEFKIIDDNFKLDGYNNVIHTATDGYKPLYKPFASENRIMGYTEYQSVNGSVNTEDETNPVQVACVEFSTSRLITEHFNSARLVVTKKNGTATRADDSTIIDIPLITYLSAIRGFGQNWIRSDQEYLDRESNWTLMFFLQNDKWVNSRISVNAWTVRINNAEFD